MRVVGRAFLIGAFAIFGLCAGPAAASQPPKRVVSMNACTDQLAMMLARPGQLHSVSFLAADPTISLYADQIDGLVLNRAGAEEVFLLKPDLVVTGAFANQTTVDLLRRLGIRVEQLPLAVSFEAIRDNVRRMGDLLGNADKADRLIEQFDADLAALQAAPRHDQTVAFYQPNNYTSGTGTLADAVVAATGLKHLGRELGYSGNAKLPLELLITSAPDLLVGQARDFGRPARAQESFDHPAFRAVADQAEAIELDGRHLVCGTPFTIEAARSLAAHADALSDDE